MRNRTIPWIDRWIMYKCWRTGEIWRWLLAPWCRAHVKWEGVIHVWKFAKELWIPDSGIMTKPRSPWPRTWALRGEPWTINDRLLETFITNSPHNAIYWQHNANEEQNNAMNWPMNIISWKNAKNIIPNVFATRMVWNSMIHGPQGFWILRSAQFPSWWMPPLPQPRAHTPWKAVYQSCTQSGVGSKNQCFKICNFSICFPNFGKSGGELSQRYSNNIPTTSYGIQRYSTIPNNIPTISKDVQRYQTIFQRYKAISIDNRVY